MLELGLVTLCLMLQANVFSFFHRWHSMEDKIGHVMTCHRCNGSKLSWFITRNRLFFTLQCPYFSLFFGRTTWSCLLKSRSFLPLWKKRFNSSSCSLWLNSKLVHCCGTRRKALSEKLGLDWYKARLKKPTISINIIHDHWNISKSPYRVWHYLDDSAYI